MKTLKKTILTAALILLLPLAGIAQESSMKSFWIHEDVVKPSMVMEYEAVCKELVSNMKKYNITEADFIVSTLSGSRYLYVGGISNMADLDKKVFSTLAEKMGGDAMSDLFKRMDKCYDIEHDYVIHLDSDLSYMPSGMTQTPEGKNYRKFHYLYITPENRDMVKEKMKAIKALWASKNSKVEYRVYKSGFGTKGEFYMVAVAAKDAVDYAVSAKENQDLLGEEGKKIMGELYKNLLKYEEYVGEMRPDMAYSPSN